MHRYFLDSSALVKRARREPESEALRTWLGRASTSGDSLFTSVVAQIEVERAIRSLAARGHRADYPVDTAVQTAVSGLSVVPLSEPVVRLARCVGPESLRSLDAIHLATAAMNGAAGLVTYDQRLAGAARAVNVPPIMPA
ncbi:MAG: type II toxin-antitoxin system VapC family toxin [Micrococcales bacterium]|nr:type II toxin-antitoxin system VapC family toxin [Micrococcales bacterium]